VRPQVIGWGLVGLGRLTSTSIAPAIRDLPGMTIAACLGSSPEKSRAFAERFGVASVHVSAEALATDPTVHAIYVCTPNALHAEPVVAAARHGKAVLCEKPLALDVAEARAMVEACERAGVVLRVAHQIRLEPVMRRIRDIVASGELGDIRALSFERNGPLADPIRAPRAAWRMDAAQGGALFDMALHLLDLAQWITAQPFREVAGLSHPDRALGVPDETITVLARLGDGCQATIRATRELPCARNDLVIQGTRGMLATSALRWADRYTITLTTPEGRREESFPACNAYRAEAEAFAGELRGIRSDLPDGREALALVDTTEAILRSIDSRRTLPVPAR
jgi:1,5-anhydro-D-fructose reductase (1,5-anhydro-D-mannitol-forming)